MNRSTTAPLVFAVTVLLAIAAGCGDHSTMTDMHESSGGPSIMSVAPSNGATGVPVGSSIHIKFDAPMDTLSVMRNFHFVGGQQMNEWMDSFDRHGHMDDGMMEWMESIDHEGHFNWNDEMDDCEFVPSTTCTPQTEYMVLMNGDIKGHDGTMMRMDHLDNNGYLFHFTTGMMEHTDGDLGTDPKDRRDDFLDDRDDGGVTYPQIVAVWPADGSTDVSPSTTVGIRFNMPMDTLSVMLSFRLSGGSMMEEWMDSSDHHGHMGGGMMDMDQMMEWMDSIGHGGHFDWCEEMDSCVFIPDSLCMPSTEYMIFMHGDMMGGNGMMMDMEDLEHEGHMFHFTTGS